MTYSFIPVLLMLLVAAALGAVFLTLNTLIGKKQRNPSKLAPYESGVPLLDHSRKRVNVRFYQIAMLFILFDIEVVFLYPVGVIVQSAESVFVLVEIGVFVFLLMVALVFVWARGALDWE